MKELLSGISMFLTIGILLALPMLKGALIGFGILILFYIGVAIYIIYILKKDKENFR